MMAQAFRMQGAGRSRSVPGGQAVYERRGRMAIAGRRPTTHPHDGPRGVPAQRLHGKGGAPQGAYGGWVQIFIRLAVVSATPSMRSMTAMRTLRMLAKNSGRRCTSISLAMLRRKLVSETTHTFLGTARASDVVDLPLEPGWAPGPRQATAPCHPGEET